MNKQLTKSIILHDFEVRNAFKNDVIQIRRPVNPKPPEWIERFGYTCFTPKGSISGRGIYGDKGPTEQFFKCPFGEVGERLLVKEAWGIMAEKYHRITYKADDIMAAVVLERKRWRPSIRIPQLIYRLTIVPEEIWVEKVQDIDWEGMTESGFTAIEQFDGCFADVWDRFYAKKGFEWEKNLPVWAGKFKVVERKRRDEMR